MRCDRFCPGSHYYLKINRNLIASKALGCLHFFGVIAMYSYSTIHAKSLGLSASQIGIILAILPLAIVFGPPVFCPLADKLRMHRWFLVGFLLFAAVAFAMLTLIPSIPSPSIINGTTVFSLIDQANSSANFDSNFGTTKLLVDNSKGCCFDPYSKNFCNILAKIFRR